MTAYVRRFLVVVLAPLAAVGAVNYVIDPFMYFRKPSLYEAQILGPQRYVHPGIARNFSYDTLITGSSMTENFSASLATRLWGGETIKVPIQGSIPREQLLLVGTALGRAHPPKRVVWGIDQDGWQYPLSTPLNPEQFPEYLRCAPGRAKRWRVVRGSRASRGVKPLWAGAVAGRRAVAACGADQRAVPENARGTWMSCRVYRGPAHPVRHELSRHRLELPSEHRHPQAVR